MINEKTPPPEGLEHDLDCLQSAVEDTRPAGHSLVCASKTIRPGPCNCQYPAGLALYERDKTALARVRAALATPGPIPSDGVEQHLSTCGRCGHQAAYVEATPGTPDAGPVDLTQEIAAVTRYVARSKHHYLEHGMSNREEITDLAEWGLSRIQYFAKCSHFPAAPTPTEETRP